MAQPFSEEEQLVDDIEDLRKIASLVLNSEFHSVIPMFKKRTDRSYYHLLGLTIFRTMVAGSYLDKKKFSIALGTCYKAYEMASKHKKKSVGFVFKTDPNEYTDCKLLVKNLIETYLFQVNAMQSLSALKCSWPKQD